MGPAVPEAAAPNSIRISDALEGLTGDSQVGDIVERKVIGAMSEGVLVQVGELCCLRGRWNGG